MSQVRVLLEEPEIARGQAFGLDPFFFYATSGATSKVLTMLLLGAGGHRFKSCRSDHVGIRVFQEVLFGCCSTQQIFYRTPTLCKRPAPFVSAEKLLKKDSFLVHITMK